jgi:diguanylate cyclase (GGDEF)-like protein
MRFGGIAVLYESPWRAVIPRRDLPDLPVRTIATENLPDDEMVLWVGTDGGGLARWRRGEWRTWTTENSIMGSDTVQTVRVVQRENRPSEVWFGVRYGGLLRLVGDRMTRYSAASGHLPHDNVQGIMVRDDVEPRELWIATRGGVVRRRGDQWTAFGKTDGLPNPSSAAMVVAPRPDGDERTVWVGTAAGLAYHNPPGWGVIPNPEGFPDLRILSLAGTDHAEGGTTLWCGTSSGVFLYDLRDGGIHHAGVLTPDSTPAIPSGAIRDIVPMGTDRVALLTNHGVLDVTRRIGQGFEDPIRYGGDHGLPIAETTDLSGHVDARGRLWIGTLRGAAVYDPTAQSRDLFADELVMDRSVALRPDGSSIPLEDGTALPANADRVVFEYRLRTLLGDQQQFRTHLVGLEALPTRWTRTSRREFSSLPPGHHEFRVWGRDRSGNVSEPVTVTFSLATPWWETLWFRAGTPAVLALIGLGIFQWRTRAIRANEALLEATVRERTESLARANEMLEDLALLDPLMGIGNRRRFDRRLDEEWRRAERSGQVLGLILIDVDHFKQYNDSRGHQAGDDCLRAVGSVVREWARRPGDDACRYGGEELALLLPSADIERCRTVAEALRLEVRGLAPPIGPVTISCGVAAVLPTRDEESGDLVERADQALYAAKQRGRDRTVTADDLETSL